VSAGRAAVPYVAPVGDPLYNGMDNGGSRMYPLSVGLAIAPPSYYGNYIGSGMGIPVNPPISALSGTTGVAAGNGQVAAAMAHPFGRNSPLPWVLGGLFLAVGATHVLHYAERKR